MNNLEYFFNFQAVINRILDHWIALIAFFETAVIEENLPSAKSVLNALKNNIYKVYFNFLSYMLELITLLNLEFQSEKSKIAVLLERVSHLFNLILTNFVKKEVLRKPDVKLSKINFEHPDNMKPLKEMYFGAKVEAMIESGVEIDKQELHTFRLRALDFYIELCRQIRMRFNFDYPHLKFASKFSIKKALNGHVNSIAEYVNLYLSIKANIELVNLEWQNLSTSFNYEDYKKSETIDFWYDVQKATNESGDAMFSNLIKVVKYIMVLPHSSAACERASFENPIFGTCRSG